VELSRPALAGPRPEAIRRVQLAPPRVPASRRAAVGCAWALAWTLVWGLAIEVYSHRAQAAPTAASPAAEQPAANHARSKSRARH
jgi:hypothetical protein